MGGWARRGAADTNVEAGKGGWRPPFEALHTCGRRTGAIDGGPRLVAWVDVVHRDGRAPAICRVHACSSGGQQDASSVVAVWYGRTAQEQQEGSQPFSHLGGA